MPPESAAAGRLSAISGDDRAAAAVGNERRAAQTAPATVDWSTVRRVLLVRLRSIGDTVLMTPSLAALKACNPEIDITVVSEPLAAPLLEDHPQVDHLLVIPPSLAARVSVIAELRRRRFDVGVNMHGGTTAMLLTRLSGARRTTGYRGYAYARLLTDAAPSPDVILGQPGVHSVEQQLALLYWLGVPRTTAEPQLSLTVSEAARRAANERLGVIGRRQMSGERFAVISPAAALASKRWTATSFARITEHLSSRWKLPAIIIAGRGEETIAEEVAAASQARPAVISGLSLKELMALISLSSLFVGNDSGPMHIAAALRRPLVAIFGSSNAEVWRPWSVAPTRVVQASPTADAETRIHTIPVETVQAAIDEVMMR